MKPWNFAVLCGAVLWVSTCGVGAAEPPPDFPHFRVEGHEQEMGTLRAMFWAHYPGSGPKATLWDDWLPQAAFWPAVETAGQADQMRLAWREALSRRIIDPEGYVATHQHASIAHQLGWPFPFWNQGRRGFGWHFSFKDTVDKNWRPHDLSATNGWTVRGGSGTAISDEGWPVEVSGPGGTMLAPVWRCDSFEVPFIQIRWKVSGLRPAEPFVEWTTPEATQFDPARRMYLPLPPEGKMTYTMVPMYRHPAWTGEIAQVRLALGNGNPGKVTLQAMFSQYDTRHNINAQNFVRGAARYFWWTRDLDFLRENIQRMRLGLRYMMTEHRAWDRKVVQTPWIGHDGRSGITRNPGGTKTIHAGRGIGNNYWDLLPFGNLDCYATVQYYDALMTMLRLEREAASHAEWQIPRGVLAFDPATLEKHAQEVKAEGNRLFWSADHGRFNACVDADGKVYDYGFTFLNLDAVYCDFATPEHAREIMNWMTGQRTVEGDTSKGADIYHWRFGPRSTTRRNIDWYFWAWNAPESIPWGGQVQDGGCVLGFSYQDLMARLRVLGPDDAWGRLREIVRWYQEVQAEGGYRAYYNGKRDGTLQGGGTAGGLGLDQEFFESVLVPQVMLYGFLGFEPRAEGFFINPQLPSAWKGLAVDRIRFQDRVLEIKATRDSLEIVGSGPAGRKLLVEVPAGEWAPSGTGDGGAARVEWDGTGSVRFQRRPR